MFAVTLSGGYSSHFKEHLLIIMMPKSHPTFYVLLKCNIYEHKNYKQKQLKNIEVSPLFYREILLLEIHTVKDDFCSPRVSPGVLLSQIVDCEQYCL